MMEGEGRERGVMQRSAIDICPVKIGRTHDSPSGLTEAQLIGERVQTTSLRLHAQRRTVITQREGGKMNEDAVMKDRAHAYVRPVWKEREWDWDSVTAAGHQDARTPGHIHLARARMSTRVAVYWRGA